MKKNNFLKTISIAILFCFSSITNAQSSFSGLGSDDSADPGYKTVTSNSYIQISNEMTSIPPIIYEPNGATPSWTLKAYGVNDFTFSAMSFQLFTGASTTQLNAGSKVTFKDKTGATLKTMTLGYSKSLQETATDLVTFFDNQILPPINNVAEIIFELYIDTDETANIEYNSITTSPSASNVASTATAPTAPTVDENSSNVALSDNIQVADLDGDDQTVSFTITGGILTTGTTNITFGGSGNGSASFTAAGTLADINTALDAATFTPTPDLYGTDVGTIAFTTNDGTVASSEASVSFDITEVNDNPEVTLAASSSAIAENGGISTLTATLDAASSRTTTVNLALSGSATSTDYSLSSETIVIAAGALSGTATITATNDSKLEADETIIVDITVTNGIEKDTQQETMTITNDDAAAVTIADISGNENSGDITVTATLDNAVQGGFSVDVSTVDGTAISSDDYSAIANQTLTFTGTEGETQTFTITPTNDTKLEGDETLTISQSNLAATTLAVNITDGATVTITNDDAAAVTIADISGNEDDGAITITATLNYAVEGGFSVDVSTTDGSATSDDYSAIANQTLSFTGTAGETQTFAFTPTVDSDLEGDETVAISMNNLVTLLSVVITDKANVTIKDDDVAAVTIADVSGNENNGAITVTATLDYAVKYGFTVDVNTTDGTATIADNDYTAIVSKTLTFVGKAGETHTFTFTPTTDYIEENDETVTISMDNLTIPLSIVITDIATVTITNDDIATAINDELTSNRWTPYPNPFTNHIYLKNQTSLSEIVVSDTRGQEIKHITVMGKEPIDLSNLQTGIYLMKAKDQNGNVQFFRILKN